MAILPRARRRRVRARLRRWAVHGTGALAYNQGFVPTDSSHMRYDIDVPGVGFDLTATHGTSAVHFCDGQTKDLARLEGCMEYRLLMQRLAQSPRSAPIRTSQRFRRWLNKKMGRPATPEIGIIGRFIQSLSDASQRQMVDSIDKIVVSAPLFPSLTPRDINDAIEYAGLRSCLKAPVPYPEKLQERLVTFGENSYGECKHYLDAEDDDEWEDLPIGADHFLSLSRDAHFAKPGTLVPSSISDGGSDYAEVDGKPAVIIPNEISGLSSCWAYIRDHMRSRYKKTSLLRAILGRPATEDFCIAVRDNVTNDTDVIYESQVACNDEKGPSSWESGNGRVPTFAAARGAALYARWRGEEPHEFVERSRHERDADAKPGATAL